MGFPAFIVPWPVHLISINYAIICAQDVAIIKQLMLRNTILISWQHGDPSSKQLIN